jgi:hypothetical protein
MTTEKAKFILRNDFVLWQRHHPNDTTRIIHLFLTQIDSMVNLSKAQKEFIKSKINSDLELFPNCNCSENALLFNKDIQPILYSALTINQYCKYLKQRVLNSWKVSKALEKLQYYYYTKRKISPDQIEDILNEEIFQ